MAIQSGISMEIPAPKGKLVRLTGGANRMDKAGTYVQTYYSGHHVQHGTVCYTKHVNGDRTWWTFSQPNAGLR